MKINYQKKLSQPNHWRKNKIKQSKLTKILQRHLRLAKKKRNQKRIPNKKSLWMKWRKNQTDLKMTQMKMILKSQTIVKKMKNLWRKTNSPRMNPKANLQKMKTNQLKRRNSKNKDQITKTSKRINKISKTRIFRIKTISNNRIRKFKKEIISKIKISSRIIKARETSMIIRIKEVSRIREAFKTKNLLIRTLTMETNSTKTRISKNNNSIKLFIFI